MIDPSDFCPGCNSAGRCKCSDIDEEELDEELEEEADADFDESECDISAARDDDFRQNMNDLVS
jgi:hypothetical protein